MKRQRFFGISMGSVAILGAALFAMAALAVWPANRGSSEASAAALVDGSLTDCEPWLRLAIGDNDWEIAEEAWVWANGTDTTDKFREASGVATKSKVASNDTPSNHYSHDWNVDIRVDPGQEGLVSDVNHPGSIELEWELGVLPGEKTGDGASPFLPRWVLPNVGDRVWTDGHWVFDCGHATEIDGVDHYRTEIHPGRALATMRSQAQTIPGSGTTPVPVTAVDLYVHGRGGFMVQQLECGADIILDGTDCPTKTTPIDTFYDFDVCLPPQPAPWAVAAWSIAGGPDDDGFGANPSVTAVPASDACKAPLDEFANDFDDSTMLHVEVDLQGTGIAPEDVYSRKIVGGWVYPPANPFPHLSLDLDKLDLHDDHEAFAFDGEFTFWWISVDRAPTDEWYRLVNFEIPTYEDVQFPCPNHTNHLDDMDDDWFCGNGELNFSGPTWDLYVDPDKGFEVHTRGFEQDCYDSYFSWGSGYFSLVEYAVCHFAVIAEAVNDWGNNDPLSDVNAPLGGPGIDPLSLLGPQKLGFPGQFDFYFTLSQVPPADEDKADLGVSKTCSWEGEVALAGEPFTCTIVVTNAGPGLPRNVVVTDTLTSSLAGTDYSVGAASFQVGTGPTSYPCGASSASGFSCDIGTVPVDGSVTITVEITPLKPGSFSNDASVSTDSTDDASGNNGAGVDVDVYLSVPLDISPGSLTNPLKVDRRGLVTVAILSEPGFDATTLNVASACFGDAEDASQRTCEEAHGHVHVKDADGDGDNDLVFHFEVLATGIDMTDTTACLKGTASDGTGFYGCDVVTPVP
jgi:uncharacterized repeat protein (TIGR01451 family)